MLCLCIDTNIIAHKTLRYVTDTKRNSIVKRIISFHDTKCICNKGKHTRTINKQLKHKTPCQTRDFWHHGLVRYRLVTKTTQCVDVVKLFNCINIMHKTYTNKSKSGPNFSKYFFL